MEAEGLPRAIIENGKPPEGPKRERLSDETMGNLISAVGNHEVKAITLGLMQPAVVYGMQDLHRMILQAQSKDKEWKMGLSVPYQYCRDSLAPIGLVAKEVINSDLSTFGYMKTEYGNSMGDSLAGLMLDFSLRYPEFSVQELFGKTGSSADLKEVEGIDFKNRSPITRVKIFWELLTSNLPVRREDIAKNIGEQDNKIGTHLQTLSKDGIILYESANPWDIFSHFKFSETAPQEEPKPFAMSRGSLPTYTQFALNLIRSNPDKEWTSDEVGDRYFESTGDRTSREHAAHLATSVLSYLAKEGYINRRGFSSRNHSEVNLTEEQKNMLFDLVFMLDNFQSQDPDILNFGKRRLKEVLSGQALTSQLILKAKEHSSGAHKIPLSESAEQVYQIISTGPASTRDEIYEALKNQGRKVSPKSVVRFLNSLVLEGKVIKKTDRGLSRYEIV